MCLTIGKKLKTSAEMLLSRFSVTLIIKKGGWMFHQDKQRKHPETNPEKMVLKVQNKCSGVARSKQTFDKEVNCSI